MNIRHSSFCLPAAFLIATACSSGVPTPKVLIIGIDGVRVDILGVAYTPHLDSLIAHGFFSNDAQTEITWSGPSWSSMLTGVWASKHGVVNNDFSTNRYDEYPDVLTRVEMVRPDLATFAAVDWPPLGSAVDGGPLIRRADQLVTLDGEANGYVLSDSLTVAAAAGHLRDNDPDLAFVYLGNVDVVGHERGSLDPAYRQAIETADRQVGILLDAIRNRATSSQEDWLILVSTDHGRLDDGSHGGTSVPERTIFYLASGPSALRGRPDRAPAIVDVGVTALAHLGVGIDPEWGLDGTVAGVGGRADRRKGGM